MMGVFVVRYLVLRLPLLHTEGSLRMEIDLIGRTTQSAKQQPSVPRHPVHSQEYLSPTELGKGVDEIVETTGASPLQRFTNRLF
jgi:hypothetical protein